MAEAIAHVKTSLRNAQTTGKPVNVLVLLTWLEARVHGMRGYLGTPPVEATAPAPEAVAEPTTAEVTQPESAEAPAPEAVPTVSDVVSRLGRASDMLEQEAHALEQSGPAAADDVPTVSMLGAMVEALTAPKSVAAEAKTEAEAPAQTAEPEVAEQAPQAEPEAAAFEVAPEAAIAETAATKTDVSEAVALETVADDPAPEIAAFAEELGTPEPAVSEPEAIVANEAEPAQAEALVAEMIIANEPITDVAVPEFVILETDPNADVIAVVSEPAETEFASIAEATPPKPSTVVSEAVAAETTDIAPTEPAVSETVAAAETTAAVVPTHEANAHEFELLTSFAAMEAIPFMRDEVGTAVIFEQKTEFDPAAEQIPFETPAKPVEAAAEPVQTAAQSEVTAEESQPEASLVQPEIETAEGATVESEPLAGIEAHVETAPEAQPAMAVAAQEPMAAAPAQFAAYVGVSAVSLGAINATAAMAGTTKPQAATAGALEIATAAETIAAETTPKIEFFDIDEPEEKAEAATAADVIAESALDAIDAEPASAEVGELAAAREGVEVTAPETAAIETTAATEAIEPEARAEVADSTQAPAEPATIEIAGTTVVTETASTETEAAIAGPTEAERAAFAQALAEMAVAAALERKTPADIEAVAAPATPPAETLDTADDDLSDLFEPEPDAALDPNNVLLGPAPVPAPAFTLDPATAAVLPMHDMALPEASKTASPQLKLVETANAEVSRTPTPAKPHDPLAPLKAMSDEEKIALFS
jgi:hypothetical protein